MPKQVPQAELDAVLQVVDRFPEGASIVDISGALAAKLPRRTLQRRLALLVEQAFFAMVQLPYLQPFEDVNKRVSRLAANLPLIRDNLSPLSFVDVPARAYIDGTLGVYELNRIELLRDVFVWAYERSCARYAAVRQSLGEPDPFRLRYRVPLAEAVAEIVTGGMDKKTAAGFIKRRAAEGIPREDQARFIEVVETAVMHLHEGNIARYRLRPSHYQKWKATWR